MPRIPNGETQNHPYPPYVPENARALILGSAPPWRFCVPGEKPLRTRDIDFYYGSSDGGGNLLWEILFRVFEPERLEEFFALRSLDLPRPSRTREERAFLQAFLNRHELGIADILLRFARREGSSADSKLAPLEFTDLLGILATRPKLRHILCTSRNKVFFWLSQYLLEQGIEIRPDLDSGDWFFQLPSGSEKIGDSGRIQVSALPSPSPVGRIRFPSQEEFSLYLVKAYRTKF